MEFIIILIILFNINLLCFYINPYLFLDINFTKKQQKKIYDILEERIKYGKYFN